MRDVGRAAPGGFRHRALSEIHRAAQPIRIGGGDRQINCACVPSSRIISIPASGAWHAAGCCHASLDALFSISFLMRGRVPAAVAAAAELDYFHMRAKQDKFIYYGRVVRREYWTVLQYWYFYCFNSWRSGFGGVNDHESDWEMVSIYLYEDDGQLIPEWVAYASHDFLGDDLRRRWDDQAELDFVDGHPVVYAGAGSHASYFRRGEYQAEANLNIPQWVKFLRGAWNKFWTQALGQEPADPFRIPFVDYARGDGLAIGAGQTKTWAPVLIDESTPWVSQYRGLWGFFARDPISGENAPAGPMYNRDGSPRASWYDPLGFAGLDKVPSPPNALRLLEKNFTELTNRQATLQASIPDQASRLQELGARLKSMEDQPHLAREYGALQKTDSAIDRRAAWPAPRAHRERGGAGKHQPTAGGFMAGIAG